MEYYYPQSRFDSEGITTIYCFSFIFMALFMIINGNSIQGDRPMTPGERKVFWKLIEKIIEALKPWM